MQHLLLPLAREIIKYKWAWQRNCSVNMRSAVFFSFNKNFLQVNIYLHIYILHRQALAKRNRKLSQLATPFDRHLRVLAVANGDLRSLSSSSNLRASERKFFTVWPLNVSRLQLVSVLFFLIRACERLY